MLESAISNPKLKVLFDSPLSVSGKVGSIIVDFLGEILPANAHELCTNKVFIQLQRRVRGSDACMGSYEVDTVSVYKSRDHLMRCILASTHLPWISDKNYFYRMGMDRFVDGQWGVPPERILLHRERPAAVTRIDIDHNKDEFIYDNLQWFELGSTEVWRQRFRAGCNYACRKFESGIFSELYSQESP